jgi:UDP-N-acetylglucosamine 2-epimerase (non-hydrolysing)
MDTGSIIVTGLERDTISHAIRVVVSSFESGRVPPMPVDYCVDNVSQRVLNLIVGTARLSATWDGLRRHDYDIK